MLQNCKHISLPPHTKKNGTKTSKSQRFLLSHFFNWVNFASSLQLDLSSPDICGQSFLIKERDLFLTCSHPLKQPV